MPALPPDQLRVRLTGPSMATQLSGVRHRVAEWTAAMGMTADVVDDVVLATHEALANVVDHAYPNGDGEAWLRAERCAPNELLVTVRDRGQWRTPPTDPGRRGHGLKIITALAERVEVHRDETGTTVEMRWRLRAAHASGM